MSQENKLKVTWEVSDGYCGASAPQETAIELSDLTSSCDTVEEVIEFVNDVIQEDFDQKITFSCSDPDHKEIISAWEAEKNNETQEN